jgi:flagellar hook-length control protein FliK
VAEEKPETEVDSEAVSQAETEEHADQAANDAEQDGNILPLEQMRKMAAEIEAVANQQEQDETAEITVPQETMGAESGSNSDKGNDETSLIENLVVREETSQIEEQVVREEKSLIEDQVVRDVEEGVEQEVAELALAANLPQQESAKATASQSVAAAVKEATGQKADVTATPVVASEEATADVDELSAHLSRQKGRGNELASQLAQQGKEGRDAEMMQRGDRGFESLMKSMPGRLNTAAASIDTLASAAAPLAGQGTGTPVSSSVPVAMTLAVPMRQANWGQAMAERVVWMTNANIQEAEIQLNPRELGPIGIKVTMNNDQANVSFVAQHASTREALEAAIPRLREMLSENGLQLGQSDVSQHSFKGREEQSEGTAGGNNPLHDDELLEGEEQLASMEGVSYVRPSGVDAFA